MGDRRKFPAEHSTPCPAMPAYANASPFNAFDAFPQLDKVPVAVIKSAEPVGAVHVRRGGAVGIRFASHSFNRSAKILACTLHCASASTARYSSKPLGAQMMRPRPPVVVAVVVPVLVKVDVPVDVSVVVTVDVGVVVGVVVVVDVGVVVGVVASHPVNEPPES